MQTTATKSQSPASQLKDPRLFREACYIDGQWVQASSGQTLKVDNPATGEIIGTVPELTGAETRQAIEAANRTFPAWSKKTAKERASVFRRRARGAGRARWPSPRRAQRRQRLRHGDRRRTDLQPHRPQALLHRLN